MKHILSVLVLALPLMAELPPIIDRDLLFGDPEIAGAQISPDGRYLAFLKPLDKTRNVWVKKINEPFASAKPVTAQTKRPVQGYFWSRDGKYVLFVQDDGGDENFNVYAVDPAGPVKAGEKVPAARNITDAKKVRAQILHISKLDPDVMWVGLNDRDPAWHDVYRVKISTGERTLVRKNTEKIAGWDFDLQDNLRLAVTVADNGDQKLMRVDGDKFTTIYTCSVFETCYSLRFHKDGKRVYAVTDHGDDVDRSRLVLMDVATGKTEAVEEDPLKRVDFGGALFNEADELIMTSYTDEKTRRYYKNKAFEADMKWLQAKFPGREVARSGRTLDEQTWLVTAYSDTEPGETYIFDRKSKKLALQYRVREKVNRAYLAAMKPIRYKSSDGLEIPAYLTLPQGVPAKNLPLVVFPHGGPWARDNWGYNSFHQYLANRGYAVLSMNFRGSTGYGKKFINAGNGEWGQKMQDDITWGVKHLVAEGVVDAKRVGISGGSYGGYATLAGVAFTPDVYAAAVAIVAPSNLITLLDSIPPYWEAGRKLMYSRMADPTTPEGKATLARQSPLNSAARIKTPLMIVQGANDPRVNQAESDQIVIALRDRNYPVKYLVAKDEGHGFANPINNLAMTTAMERFFEQHLGGRSQKEVPQEVANKLDQLTVDPKSVVLAKKVEASASTQARPERGLPVGTFQYALSIAMGAQKISLSLSTDIRESAEGYTLVEKMSSPMGEGTDTAVVAKGSLSLRARKSTQGPMTMELTATDAKVTGAVTVNGNAKPIDVATGGPLFGDTAGGFAIGALPLAEGYTATYQGFDAQKMKVKVTQLRVAGSEPVKVPAGTFETWKVETKPGDGSGGGMTVWIDKASRKPVKMQASLPAAGGATMTGELQ